MIDLKQAKIIILGMGITGQSCARYFQRRGIRFAMFDQNINAEKQAELMQRFNAPCFNGELNYELLQDYDCLCVSPGIALNQPVMQQAIAEGKTLISDIELFVNEVSASLIAITGSNGKTTVTTWLNQLLNQAGISAQMAGNIGTPVLDLLQQEQAEVYVLELSSFQLDLYKNIPLHIAVVLNITQDHLDRYNSFADYQQSKLSICEQADIALLDSESYTLLSPRLQQKAYRFGIGQGDFILQEKKSGWKISGEGFSHEFDAEFMPPQTERLNALVVAAIAHLLKIEASRVEPLLKELGSLAHRNQQIAVINGVRYVNDSKATNVGAVVAAIKAQHAPVILIAGGLAKGADFTELGQTIDQFCKVAILIGKDRQKIAASINKVACQLAESLQQAVELAKDQAESGDTVLLSPACASFDMFRSYQDRGNQFITAVEALQSEVMPC